MNGGSGVGLAKTGTNPRDELEPTSDEPSIGLEFTCCQYLDAILLVDGDRSPGQPLADGAGTDAQPTRCLGLATEMLDHLIGIHAFTVR